MEQLEEATSSLRQAGVEMDLLGGSCEHMRELSAQHGSMMSATQALRDYLLTLNTLLGVARGAPAGAGAEKCGEARRSAPTRRRIF